MKCASVVCAADAVALPEIQVPALGHDFTSPISMTLALPLCMECAGLFKLDPQLVIETYGVRQAIDALTVGKVPPDYVRARVVVRRLNAAELAGFLARSALADAAASGQRRLH